MAEFFTVITDAGREAVARATQAGEKVNITHFAVGDGGGVPVTPQESQTQLVNECWRGLVSTYKQEGTSLIIDTYIPPDEESFTVREMGVFTADGVLFAVCNTPEMRKVLPSEGAVGSFVFGMELDVTNIDMRYIEIHTNPMLPFINEGEKGQPDGVAPLNKDGVLEIKYGGTDANDSQNALYNLGCGVRKNYFDNPDFKINQEKAEYNIPISMGKIVDRWYSEGIGNCEYTENGIITNSQYARQMWSSSTITAGKWTVSALCTGDIAVVFGKYGYADIKVNASSTNYDNGLASVTFDIPQSLLNQISYNDYIYIMCKSGLGTNKGLLKYVKFEKGETQTLARKLEDGSWKLFETPDYATELAKCQYYFERVGNDKSEVLTNSVYVPVGAKAVTFIIPFNYKRINPTVSFSELSQYRLLIQFANETNGATSVDIKSFGLISSTKTAAKVTITLADPTPVDGYMVLQRVDIATAAWIDVSAEF